MYKYYQELEKPDEFKIYLTNYDINNFCSINLEELDVTFYQRHSELFNALNYLDSLILPDITREQTNRYYEKTGEFLMSPKDDEYYSYIEGLKKKMSLGIYDVIDIFRFYSMYMKYYEYVFPGMESFFKNIEKLLNAARAEINCKRKIALPDKDPHIELRYPNAWFITPNGYLYNTGQGHKEGSLVYAYNRICDSVDGGMQEKFVNLTRTKAVVSQKTKKVVIPHMNNSEKIKNILDRGYVDYYDFINYSNLMYQFLTDPLIDGEKDVSYQKNIITVVVGYLSASDSLYQAYARLNKSKRIKDMVKKVGKLSNGDLADILVRFAGFSKVESQRERTITTSAIDGIDKFKEYLDRGWNLDIIPGIVYDQYRDDVDVANMDSLYVQRYLDKALIEYQGKGKVLINRRKYM